MTKLYVLYKGIQTRKEYDEWVEKKWPEKEGKEFEFYTMESYFELHDNGFVPGK